MPFFTVVTIVLNDIEGLRRTADSVLSQGFDDYEWRIVDGGSTDGTSELAFALGESAPGLLVTSGRDASLYDAMNKGLRQAEGAYIMFMNAGDEYAGPNILQRLHEELSSGDWDILFGSTIMRFAERDLRRPAKSPSYLWHGQPGMHQSTAFRTSLHRRHEYNPQIRVTADYECLARMAVAGARMISVNFVISINEITPRSVSTRYRSTTLIDCYRTQRDILKVPLWRRILSMIRRGVNEAIKTALARRGEGQKT